MTVETLGILLGVAVSLAVAWPFVRRKQALASLELLRSELAIESQARKDQAERCTAELKEQDRRHSVEIAELRGRLAAQTPEFARTLAGFLREEGIGA
jgi:hypothetical protein